MPMLSLYPNRVLDRVIGHDVDGLIGQGYVRDFLTADRTYYVLKTGNDLNTGLTNNAAGAFLSIQRAVDVVSGTLDANGHDVTIQVGPGAWTSTVTLKNYVGQTNTLDPNWLVPTGPKILGDRTTPSNVTMSGGAQFNGSTLTVPWKIDGFTLGGTASGVAVVEGPISGSGVVYLGKVVFALTSGRHMSFRVSPTENYSITGGAQSHIFSGLTGLTRHHINYAALTVTLTGSMTFSIAFAQADAAFLESYSPSTTFNVGGATFTGTSHRYSISSNCVMQTYGGGANYFPGNAVGVTDGSAAIYA